MNNQFVLGLESRYALERAVYSNGADTSDVEWLCQNFRFVMMLARGDAELVFKKPTCKPEPALDFSVHVERGLTAYPIFVKKVICPRVWSTGPADYNLSTDVEKWLNGKQKNAGDIIGLKIYERLKGKNMLKDCLNLFDFEEIQKKGIDVFRKLFSGKAIFAWKSVISRRSNVLYVPVLYEKNGIVVLGWRSLNHVWLSSDITPLFKKSKT